MQFQHPILWNLEDFRYACIWNLDRWLYGNADYNAIDITSNLDMGAHNFSSVAEFTSVMGQVQRAEFSDFGIMNTEIEPNWPSAEITRVQKDTLYNSFTRWYLQNTLCI